MPEKRIKITLDKGFSLTELMFGVVIMAVVICGTLLTFVQCMFLNESSRNLYQAANDAQSVLEDIKAAGYDKISTYTTPTFSNLPSENLNVVKNVGANLASVTVNVAWQERQSAKTFSLSTYFVK